MTMQKAISALSFVKACAKCGVSKSCSDFGKHSLGKNGLNPACKACVNARSKEWASKNKERKNESSKAWGKAHPERIKTAKKKYQASEKGRIATNEANAQYRANNPDKVLAWRATDSSKPTTTLRRALYKRANLINGRVNESNRRARKKMAGGTHSKGDIQNLHHLQRGKCACCTARLNGKYHVDHIVPLAKKGGNDKKNLQLLCPACNLHKQARDPIIFMQSRGYLL